MIQNKQREILEAFYNETAGDHWTNNDGWLSGKPLWEWHGIRVNDEGYVWSIDLSENNLKGKIPASLFGLSKLKNLTLRENKLSGEIPPEIGQCRQMQNIDLSKICCTERSLKRFTRFSIWAV